MLAVPDRSRLAIFLLTLGCVVLPAAVAWMAPAAAVAAAEVVAEALRYEAAAYVLDVTFTPAARSLSGRAEITLANPAAALDTLTFYLHGELLCDAVACGGRDLAFRQDPVFYGAEYSHLARRVQVPVADTDLGRGLQVRWHGEVNRSAARSPSDYMHIGTDGVFLRALYYSFWFPVFVPSRAQPETVDFTRVVLRTPRELVPVFTGELVDERVEGDQRVSTWTSPRTTLVRAQCTARPYRVLADGGVRVYHLDDPASTAGARRILDFARRLRAFYQAHYRRGVAAGQLHVAQLCPYGDISSGNMIGLAEDDWQAFAEASYPGRTLAHELVHAYVFVPTDESDATYALMCEGFPSYLHLPGLAALLGEDWYDDILDGIAASYLEKRRTGKTRRGDDLPPGRPLLELTAADIGTYKDVYILADRARLFFDHLRRRLGPDGFLALIGDLVNRDRLDREVLRDVVLAHAPDFADAYHVWLETDDYPASLRRP